MTAPATAPAAYKSVLTAADVAALFGRSTRWFYANKKAMIADGFPKALPHTSGRLWSRKAIERWLEDDAAPIGRAHRVITTFDRDAIERAGKELDRRIAAL